MHRYPDPHIRHRRMRRQEVLQLDVKGMPQDWISIQAAASYMATDSVAWFDGEGPLARLRGGMNAKTGIQSMIEVHPIIAMRGASKINLFELTPAFSRTAVLLRDRLTCGFCGIQFEFEELTIDHLVPRCKGGGDTYQNTLAACKPCNQMKGSKTLMEARMQPVFLPYVPSTFESFLLQGRTIRADVHDWLKARIPKHSRLN